MSDYDSTVDSFVLLPPYTGSGAPHAHPRHPSPTLVVTTRLLPQFKFRAGELVDVIGEVQVCWPAPRHRVVCKWPTTRVWGVDVDAE